MQSVKNMKNFWDRMTKSGSNGPTNGDISEAGGNRTEPTPKIVEPTPVAAGNDAPEKDTTKG